MGRWPAVPGASAFSLDIGNGGSGDAAEVIGSSAEDMARGPGGGPDGIESEQVLVEQEQGRGEMADRRDTSDGEAGGKTDPISIGAGERHAQRGRGLLGIHSIGAGGDDDGGALAGPEDD